MKYGESAFDLLYLLTAIGIGIFLCAKAKNRVQRLMGIAALVLGFGDAFHLVPRVLNYFIEADFTAALGIGKLVTSITMTVFYVLLYRIGCLYYGEQPPYRAQRIVIWSSVMRIVLCLFPQNGWLQNESPLLWGVVRNVPFAVLGAAVMLLFFRNRKNRGPLRLVWLWITLSFAFYLPVAFGAGFLPILGMLMLPKTICYVAILLAFCAAAKGDSTWKTDSL